MLSGDGNAGGRWKTAIGLISKKSTLRVQHTFLHISLPLFCTTTTWNFQKLLRRYTLFGGCTCSRSPFFTAANFHLAFVADSISHFRTATTEFSCCPSKKKMSPLFFLSLALALCRPFSRWASLACRLLRLFLCLSLALYSKFVYMTINLLIL